MFKAGPDKVLLKQGGQVLGRVPRWNQTGWCIRNSSSYGLGRMIRIRFQTPGDGMSLNEGVHHLVPFPADQAAVENGVLVKLRVNKSEDLEEK